ncbi:WD40 repeat domain-containing protein, partial [Streptomyces violaceoruber]
GKKLLLGMEGVNSPVKAEDVPGGGGDSGGGSGSGSHASGADSDGPGGDTLKVGAVGLLVALAALFGLRRIFRRR